MIISPKLSDKQLMENIHVSAVEYNRLVGRNFLIIGKNRNSPYIWFECTFEKRNFMHLLGIRSNTLKPTQFFEKALEGFDSMGNPLTLADCTPSRNHSRRTINEKCSCSAELFRLKEAKFMKIGIKDKISQYVDFKYAYGNNAILGFQESNGIVFPITLIPRAIDEFTTQKYRILFIMEKQLNDESFQKIYMEIKKGLFDECEEQFPEELLDLISK